MTQAIPDLAGLFDEAPCGLIVTRLDGTIVKANGTFCDWIGIPRDELVGAKRLQELFTMGGRIFHQTHWAPSLQMQGSLAEVKFDLRHRDGRTIPMILNARRRQRPEGEFDEIAAFVAEDRNRYERELMGARRKADALLEAERETRSLMRDRALFAEQMVGIVSHDLRNPLSAILMGVQMLERVDGERRTRILGHVRNSAERAQRLIEELLDFTQARVGQGLTVNRRAVDLHEVVDGALSELRLAYPGRTIEFASEGDSACVADADRLAQLIGNLVSNAAAYGQVDTPVFVRSSVAGATAEIVVRNLGAPIPEAVLADMFEPMVRGETGSNTVRSVGLGLFIVREIARAHGGDMSVTSTVADGTSFGLRFPAHAEGLPS
jgi:sigma-B regulation protein RsbU (phosphoserine phosphatase)